MKTCVYKGCEQVNPQPLSAFSTDKRASTGLQSKCKSCCNKAALDRYYKYRDQYRDRAKIRYANNPGRVKEQNLKRWYGINLSQYNEMLVKQDNKCAICSTSFAKKTSKWSACLDHDHRTGKVRDILCSRCNSTLGYLEDSAELTTAIADYIQRHK